MFIKRSLGEAQVLQPMQKKVQKNPSEVQFRKKDQFDCFHINLLFEITAFSDISQTYQNNLMPLALDLISADFYDLNSTFKISYNSDLSQVFKDAVFVEFNKELEKHIQELDRHIYKKSYVETMLQFTKLFNTSVLNYGPRYNVAPEEKPESSPSECKPI